MKRAILTSSFQGHVTLMYGEPGIGEETFPPLLTVDFKEAQLNDTQKGWLMRYTPARLEPGFEQAWGEKIKVTVEVAELDFEKDFWLPYNKQVNRKRSEQIWGKMTAGKRLLAVSLLARYKRYLIRNNWRTQLDPENYLKKEVFLTDWDALE